MFLKNMESPARLSLLMLFLLLALQFSLFSYPRWSSGPKSDERYHIAKANHLLKHGELSAGKGKGNWRPAGYALILAFWRSVMGNWTGARVMVATSQFTLVVFALLIFQAIACSVLKKSYFLLAIAFLLGVQPWAFEECRAMKPDSLTASMTTLGLLGLFAFVVKKGLVRNIFFFSSCIVLCATIFLRPEMVVMVPVLIGASLFLNQENRTPFSRHAAYAVIIFSAFLVLQVSYRVLSTGQFDLYGRFAIIKRGAHNWTNTWFSTERIAYDNFLHKQHIFNTNVDIFPEHAFADQVERAEIQRALDLARQKKTYDKQVDQIFQAVADKRLRDNFFVNFILTRLWRTFLLWFNFEDNNRLSVFLGSTTLIGKVLVHLSHLLKVTIFFLAGYSLYSTIGKLRNGTANWYHRLTALMLLCVIMRTLLIGIVLGWMIDRYALVAWPAMLWCAVSGMIDLIQYKTGPAK